MSLIKRSDLPVFDRSLLSDFFDDERWLNSPWLNSRSMPAVNIKENEKDYEVELAVPGYDKKDFNISVEDGLLTVSAEKRLEKEKEDGNYRRREFGFSSFSRSFSLPTNSNENGINASYKDGVLILTIAKKEGTSRQTRKAIDIK